jgi:26S proteasome regulatory subunit N6
MRKGLYDNLIDLQKEILPKFKDFPKTKTAKIIRTLYDLTLTIPAPEVKDALERHYKMLMDTARFIIEWCKQESRSFLRMRIETNLAELLHKTEKHHEALEILKNLNYELKKKEDKQLLVESQLVEAKVYHALGNLPKSKASLTSVKTTANSIYVIPNLQAEIDMMSGMLSADEKDYTTAYSYFYETFEGYRSMNELEKAGHVFKFMLFSKIMGKQSEDALALINSALALKYQGPNTTAMKAVAQANKNQSLADFSKCTERY